MAVQTLSSVDRTVFQPLGRIIQEAFSDGFIANFVRGSDSYAYGAKFVGDGFFLAGAGKKTYLVYIGGDRAEGEVVTGDSNDALLRMGHTNSAACDSNFIMRGINGSLSNSDDGTLNLLEGINYSVRQRSTVAITALRAALLSVQTDVGKGAINSEVKGLKVEMRLEQDMPSNCAGVEVRNYTDGVYDLPTAAFAVKNDGTSGCKGFEYGLDVYDANAKTWNTAPIRLGYAGSEDVVITYGDFTDGADSGFAPGSIGLDSDGVLMVVDSGGLWQTVTHS
jgi:hypothetical protein